MQAQPSLPGRTPAARPPTGSHAGAPSLPVRDTAWFHRVMARINGDAEMSLLGRHFSATASFVFGSERHDLVVQQGTVIEVRHGKKIDWRADFGFRAPDAVWDRFFSRPAPPLYNSVFAMIMRVPEFQLEGDTLVFAQNARAMTRLLELMQQEGQPPEPATSDDAGEPAHGGAR